MEAAALECHAGAVQLAWPSATLLVDLPPEVPLKIRVVPTNHTGEGIACEVTVDRRAAG